MFRRRLLAAFPVLALPLLLLAPVVSAHGQAGLSGGEWFECKTERAALPYPVPIDATVKDFWGSTRNDRGGNVSLGRGRVKIKTFDDRIEVEDENGNHRYRHRELPKIDQLVLQRRGSPEPVCIDRLWDGRVRLARYGSALRVEMNGDGGPQLGNAWLIDIDGNGSFGDAGTDGFIPPGGGTISAFDGFVYALTTRYEVKADGTDVSFREAPYANGSDNVDLGIAVINHYRQSCGLLPVEHDRELAASARAHASFMKANDAVSDRQNKRDRGYTEGGADAAKNSLVARDSQSNARDIATAWNTVVRGMDLLHPKLSHVGFGIVDGFVATDIRSGRRGRGRGDYAVWPPSGSMSAPTWFSHDEPKTVPGIEDVDELGPAIRLWFDGRIGDGSKIKLDEWNPRAKAWELSPVWGKRHRPDDAKKRDELGVVCRYALKKATMFRATATVVAGRDEQTIVWYFRTGNGRKPTLPEVKDVYDYTPVDAPRAARLPGELPLFSTVKGYWQEVKDGGGSYTLAGMTINVQTRSNDATVNGTRLSARELPAIVPLGGHRAVCLDHADGVWRIAPHFGWSLKVGEHDVWLVDVNGDGEITDDGSDGWITHGGGAVATFEGFVVTPVSRWRLKVTARDGGLQAFAAEVPWEVTDPRFLETQQYINHQRATMGLGFCIEDVQFSAACSKHAIYMRLNRQTVHVEEKDKPGFSPEGALAGRTSNVAGPGFRLIEAVKFFFMTVHHMLPYQHPQLRKTGFAIEDGGLIVNAVRGHVGRKPDHIRYVPWPPGGGTNAHRKFAESETPQPYPIGASPARCGTSVNLWLPFKAAKGSEIALSTRGSDGSWEDVPVHGMENRGPESIKRRQDLGCVAQSHLRATTVYRAIATVIRKWTVKEDQPDPDDPDKTKKVDVEKSETFTVTWYFRTRAAG